MLLRPFLVAVASLAIASTAALAQNPPQQSFGPPQGAPPQAAPPPIAAIPQELDALVSEPSTHFAFTFDRSMLADAAALLGNGSGAPPTAGISAVTVTTYRYQRPAFYDPEAMSAVIATYGAAGWKHLVNANATPARSARPDQPITDLWLHFQGTEIDDVAVLIRAPRQMNLIQVSGLLRPLDLIHLAGHFGIPKVDPSAVMVPAPTGR